MGIYDTLEVKHDCPYCGIKLDSYQTKVLENTRHVYKLGDSISTEELKITEGEFNIIDSCTECDEFINARAIVEEGVISKIVEKRKGIETVVAYFK